MTTLAGWGVLALLAAGFGGAILGDRWVRLTGVLAMLSAAAAALATELGPAAALWLAAPLLVSLAQGPAPARPRLAFDPLARRAAVVGILAMGASLAALQFPISDLPRPLAATLWNLAALGISWIVVADDTREFVSGATLAIAGGSALLLVGSSTGPMTPLFAGALAALPTLILLRRPPGWLAYAVAVGAGLTVLLLLYGGSTGATLADLNLNWRPPALLAAAVLLVGASATQSGRRGLVTIPATLMLVTVSPALRWAALAAAVTLLLEPEDRDWPLAWAGLALIASSLVLGGALDPGPRMRLIVAALAGGWLLVAGGRRAPALQAGIASMFLLIQVPTLSPDAAGRFQLLAAITAVFLLAGMLIDPRGSRRPVSLGLSLIGLSAMTATGTLAAILLILDAFLIEATAEADGGRLWQPVRILARSGWPPTVAFAGRTLAVLAAMATSTLLGAVALALLLALLLAPVLDQQPAVTSPFRRGRAVALAVISLAAGLVPGWVARLGHL